MTAYFSTGAGGAVLVSLAAIVALISSSGTLKISTTAASQDPDSWTAGTILATFTIASIGAGSVSGSFPSKLATSTVTFSASTVAAAASGTAASFGLFTSGATCVATGSVSTTGADINFNSVAFSSGANITLSSFALTLPE